MALEALHEEAMALGRKESRCLVDYCMTHFGLFMRGRVEDIDISENFT